MASCPRTRLGLIHLARLRLEEEQSERAPFDAKDLQTIFDAPLFRNERYLWQRRVTRVCGSHCCTVRRSRQAEFAGLRVADIREDENARYPLMWFTRDRRQASAQDQDL